MSYESFIYDLNTNKIKKINFHIDGFSHYGNCVIYRQVDTLKNNKNISLIVCRLTDDDYEKVSFLNTFDESYKLFNFGRKGKFTLKQVWDKVRITEIVFAE